MSHAMLNPPIRPGRKETLKKLTISLCLALTAAGVLLGPVSAMPVGTSTGSLAQEDRHFSHKEAEVEFERPKGWKAKPDGEGITVSTPQDNRHMVFLLPAEY